MTNALIADGKGKVVGNAIEQGNPTRIVWAGKTTDATPKELFLDGGADQTFRMIVHNDVVIQAEGLFLAYNDTDETVYASGRFSIGVKNIAGAVSANGATLEWDAASADANPFVQYTQGSAGLAFTYDNTNKAVVLTVTGVAAKSIRWKAEILDYIHIKA